MKEAANSIDLAEAMLLAEKQVDCPVKHHFTQSLYVREIFMPAGTLITSKIHKTEHPYFILKGKVTVFTEEDGTLELEAPYVGITKPGTRRVLYIREDTVWATAHVDFENTKDVSKIAERIIQKHDNPIKLEKVKEEKHELGNGSIGSS